MNYCEQLNLDHIFAYTTVAQVKIQDRRLGVTRLLLLVFAFVWVVVYNVVINKGWARVEPVEGLATMVGANPTVASVNGEEDCFCFGGQGSTVCGNHTCYDRYSNFTDLPYCMDSSLSYTLGKTAMEKHRCIRIDAVDVMTYTDNSIFLTTHIKYEYQTFNGEVMNGPMAPVVTKPGKMWTDIAHPTIPDFFGIDFYATDISKYNFVLEHGINNGRKSSLQIRTGVLRSKNKALCRKLGANLKVKKEGNSIFYCDIKPKQTYDCRVCTSESCKREECGYDMFKLEELLLAGETEEDELAPLINPLDKPIRQNSNVPFRYQGLVMKLIVTYTDNTALFPYKGDVTYFYTVELLVGPPNARKEATQDWRGSRTINQKHGISVQIVVDGFLHKFDLQTLLVQLTSILGLTSIIGLTIEFVMLKCLKASGYYKSVKFSESVEYGRLKKLPGASKHLEDLSMKEIKELAEQDKKSIVWTQNSLELQNNIGKGTRSDKNSWVDNDA